jgi:hypothetical protein
LVGRGGGAAGRGGGGRVGAAAGDHGERVAPGRGWLTGVSLIRARWSGLAIRACHQWTPSISFQAGLAQILSDREAPQACLGSRRAGQFCYGSAQRCRIVEMFCAVKRTVLVAR